MSDELMSAMRRYGAVSVKGASLKLPYTTSCSGAKAGDRCIIQAIGPHAIVIGVLAK